MRRAGSSAMCHGLVPSRVGRFAHPDDTERRSLTVGVRPYNLAVPRTGSVALARRWSIGSFDPNAAAWPGGLGMKPGGGRGAAACPSGLALDGLCLEGDAAPDDDDDVWFPLAAFADAGLARCPAPADDKPALCPSGLFSSNAVSGKIGMARACADNGNHPTIGFFVCLPTSADEGRLEMEVRLTGFFASAPSSSSAGGGLMINRVGTMCLMNFSPCCKSVLTSESADVVPSTCRSASDIQSCTA